MEQHKWAKSTSRLSSGLAKAELRRQHGPRGRTTQRPVGMRVRARYGYSGVQMAGLTMPIASTPPPLIVQR